CPNQLQSLVRALHHVGGDGLAKGYDSKDLHPKMARYVGEQSKCCHPSKNFAGSQSREGGQDISDLHRWMQCQTTACYGSPDERVGSAILQANTATDSSCPLSASS